MQELLGLERLGCDPRTFTQLENRLLGGRPVPAGAEDEHPVRRPGWTSSAERRLDRAGSQATSAPCSESSPATAQV